MLRVRPSAAVGGLLRSASSRVRSYHTLAALTHTMRALPTRSHVHACAASSWTASRVLLAPKQGTPLPTPQPRSTNTPVGSTTPSSTPPAGAPAAAAVAVEEEVPVAASVSPFWGSSVQAGLDWRWFVSPNPADRSGVRRTFLGKMAFLAAESATIAGAFGTGMVLNTGLWIVADPLLSDADALDILLVRGATFMPLITASYIGLIMLTRRLFPKLMAVPAASAIAGVRRARGRSGWGRLGVVVVLGFVFLAGQALLVHLSDSPTREVPLLVETALDSGSWTPLVCVGIAGPALEEILFRGLIFARTMRFVGPIRALLFSSAIFGLVHWSPDSNKIMASAGAGTVFAMMYRSTQTLLAPFILHAANNSAQVLSMRECSPLLPLDSVFLSLEGNCRRENVVEWISRDLKSSWVRFKRVFGFAKEPKVKAVVEDQQQQPSNEPAGPRNVVDLLTALVSPAESRPPPPPPAAKPTRPSLAPAAVVAPPVSSAAVFNSWLSRDLLTLTPNGSTLVGSLFGAMDRSNKGHLSAEELGWILSLQPDKHIMLNGVVGIVERRVGGRDEQEQLKVLHDMRRNIDTLSPQLMQQTDAIHMPSTAAAFFNSADGKLAAAESLSATLASLPTSSSSSSPSSSSSSTSPDSDTPAATPLLLPPPQWDSMPLVPSVPHPKLAAPSAPTPTSKALLQTQRDLINRYYALYWTAFHRTHFPASEAATIEHHRRLQELRQEGVEYQTRVVVSADAVPVPIIAPDAGCTLARFESYVARELLLRPAATAAWLNSAVAVLQGSHEHPTAQIMQRHEQGRQAFQGKQLIRAKSFTAS